MPKRLCMAGMGLCQCSIERRGVTPGFIWGKKSLGEVRRRTDLA